MKLLTTALLATTTLAVVVPAASAQSYQAQTYQECETERQNRQVAGALIGGILGAVVGAELADENSDNRYYDDRYYGHRGHGYNRGHRGHQSRHRRHHPGYYDHRDSSDNDLAIVAGAGLGALVGAGVASGEDCANKSSHTYNQQGYYGQNNPPSTASYNGYNGYNPDQQGQVYSAQSYQAQDNSGLIGGPQPTQGRVYQAGSGDWTCEWMNTQRMGQYGQPAYEQVYMCQGADGIWRPYDTYTSN